VVPLTGWQDGFERKDWMVRLDPSEQNGVSKPSAVNAFQVRCISTSRFQLARRRRGMLSDEELKRVLEAVRKSFA